VAGLGVESTRRRFVSLRGQVSTESKQNKSTRCQARTDLVVTLVIKLLVLAKGSENFCPEHLSIENPDRHSSQGKRSASFS
jgi:hypothetical protein